MVKRARKRVLVIKRQKHRRNQGKLMPIQPELIKNTQLKKWWKDDKKLMSQYGNIGLVQRFKKLQEDALLKKSKKKEEEEEPVFKSVEEVENEEGMSESEQEEQEEEGVEPQPKSVLREIVEEEMGGPIAERPKRLKEWEVPIVKKLVDKYNDNYKKMFKDLKLNCMQWDKAQLKKKCEAYKSINE